jgi:hypothetical protein
LPKKAFLPQGPCIAANEAAFDKPFENNYFGYGQLVKRVVRIKLG